MSTPLAAPERPGGPPPAPPAPARAGEWPSPRGMFVVAAAAGLVAAVSLPGERPGLGVLLTALAVAAATATLRGRTVESEGDAKARGSAGPERDLVWPRVWAVLAMLLASVAVVRDAGWVVWPSILGAIALGAVAVGAAATWRSLISALAVPFTAPRGAAAVARAAGGAFPAGSGERAAPILRGAAIATGLVVVFGVLFLSGDRAFAQIAEDSLPSDVEVGLFPVRLLAFAGVAALVGAFVLARRTTAAPTGPTATLRTAEWAIPLAALNLLFAAFVAVQFAVLFGGDERVLETTGLTYAEYAREGYGQLLVAAALTLAVIGGALRWARGDRRVLRVLLAALCLLTGVVLASALHRLDLYQDAFGATRLRFTATATLVWLGAILALALAALALDRHGFVPRAALLVTALGGFAFAAWNPDLRIAERNLQRDSIDRAYLRTLSADAAPALPPALEARRDPDGWGGFNLARR